MVLGSHSNIPLSLSSIEIHTSFFFRLFPKYFPLINGITKYFVVIGDFQFSNLFFYTFIILNRRQSSSNRSYDLCLYMCKAITAFSIFFFQWWLLLLRFQLTHYSNFSLLLFAFFYFPTMQLICFFYYSLENSSES